MRIKSCVDESLDYYEYPVLLVAVNSCDFKCCIENRIPITTCINQPWAKRPSFEIPNQSLIETYIRNPITKAVCFAGLEPMLQSDEIYDFISEFRKASNDLCIIYTGYYKQEIADKVKQLQRFPNIIIKFGRYVPNQEPHYDPVLKVKLANDEQFAERIS